MTIWTTGKSRMLKLMGQKCSATINNECVSFYGIFDQNAAVEDVDGYGPKVVGSTLVVDSTITEDLTFNTEVTIGTKTWYIRQWLVQDDGEFSTLIITEKPSDN